MIEQNAFKDHEDWIEIEGSSKQDALERACTALNTTQSYLDYEVVDGPGFKIRARKSQERRSAKRIEPDDDEAASKEANNYKEKAPEIDDRDYEKLSQEGLEILKHVLKFISPENEIFVDHTEEEIILEIEADGSGLLIGKRGQMLEALQHIVAKMLGLDRSSSKRLIVDSEGYRHRRQVSLEALAKKMASKAKRNRRTVTLEPMTAMDRRVIHLALSDDRYITTKSVGEGSERKILISPKRGMNDKRGSRNGGRGGFNRGRNQGYGNRGSSQGRGRQTKPNRLHDSYDVPAEPKMDIFPDNIDEMMDADFNVAPAAPRRRSGGSNDEE
ncbi:MAG: KH domain-containing protein [Bdellovibrionales bacterium]|nr:KH domain-containing protein [Bdellovibrionales bacterium]